MEELVENERGLNTLILKTSIFYGFSQQNLMQGVGSVEKVKGL